MFVPQPCTNQEIQELVEIHEDTIVAFDADVKPTLIENMLNSDTASTHNRQAAQN